MIDLPPADPSIEIVVASRGISKGLAQTDGPQVVARGEVAIGRLFVGAYAKNVSSPTSDGEAAAFVGMRLPAGGFELSASAAYKRSIAPVGAVDSEALELVGGVSRRIGPVTLRTSVTWSPDDLGSTGRTTFAEAGAAYRFGSFTAGGALGVRERDGGPDYTAWNAGVAYTVASRFTIDLRYFDTARRSLGDPFRARLVASVRARF